MKVARTRGDELRAEAASNRSIRPDDCADGVLSDGRRFTGRQFHLGSILIVFGRTLREEETRCADAART
jgi:hypothetical protein